MRLLHTILPIVLLATGATCLRDAVPLAAWSGLGASTASPVVFATEHTLTSQLSPLLDALQCGGVVLVVEQEGVKLKDFAGGKHSCVKRSLNLATSSLQIPHVVSDRSIPHVVDDIVGGVCANVERGIAAASRALPPVSTTHLTLLTLHLTATRDADSILEKTLEELADTVGEKYVVVFAGVVGEPTHHLVARQTVTLPPELQNFTGPWSATAYSKRPIFQKYWLSNNGVFHGIVAVIPFVLILWTGISWISDLQTNEKFEKKKPTVM